MAYQMQYRELDPRFQTQQQQAPAGNPYFRDMLAMDENNLNRQLNLMQQSGRAEAQKAQAELANNAAWTRGLDAFTRSALPAAESVQGMRIKNRAQEEAEKTGGAQRANLMESTARTHLQNELDRTYAARERESGIGATQAGTRLTEANIMGANTANQMSQLDLQAKQRKEDFLQTNAAQAGFTGARPNENIAAYTMRMEQEGKIAEVEQVKALAKKTGIEADLLPKRWEEEKKMNAAQRESLRASAANAYGQLKLAQQEGARAQETYATERFNRNFGAFVRGVDEGSISVPAQYNVYGDKAKAQFLLDYANDYTKKNGLDLDGKIAVVQTLASLKSADAAAMANKYTLANADAAQKENIDAGIKGARIAREGTSALAMLKNAATQYSGAGAIKSSEEAKSAALQIKAQLQKLAETDPIFKPFLVKFEEIDTGVYGGPSTILNNLPIINDSPSVKLDKLIDQLASTIQSSLAGTPRHWITNSSLDSAQQVLEQTRQEVKQKMASGNILDSLPPSKGGGTFTKMNPMAPAPMPNAPGWTGQAIQQQAPGAANPLQYIQQQRQGGNPGW